ncbi:MAG: AgmX/PglI C-terminal domain-containing protein [Bradymonadaceae bacterium]
MSERDDDFGGQPDAGGDWASPLLNDDLPPPPDSPLDEPPIELDLFPEPEPEPKPGVEIPAPARRSRLEMPTPVGLKSNVQGSNSAIMISMVLGIVVLISTGMAVFVLAGADDAMPSAIEASEPEQVAEGVVPEPASDENVADLEGTFVSLQVTSNPPGARVRLDDEHIGLTPLMQNVPYGEDEVSLTLSLRGHQDEQVTIVPGEDQHVEVLFESGSDESSPEEAESGDLTVTIGDLQVTGSFDESVLEGAMAQHQQSLLHCYEYGYRGGGAKSGTATLSIVLSPSGNVASAMVRESTLQNRNIEDCIAGQARRWTFPAPAEGGIVRVDVTLNFHAGTP